MDSEELLDTVDESVERSTQKRKLSEDESDHDDSAEQHQSSKRSRRKLQIDSITKHIFGKESEDSEATRSNLAQDSIEASRPRVTDTQSKPEILNRNKRLFGSLIGHLGRAKNNLEKESEKISRQKQLQATASEKRAQALQKQKEREERLRNLDQLSKQITEEKSKFDGWKSRTDSQSNFLSTKHKPAILWLPKQHNAVTTTLLDHRINQITSTIADREAAVNKTIHSLQEKVKELQQLESHDSKVETDS